MVLDMMDAYHINNVALNVKLFVTNEPKYKQSDILTSIHAILNHCTHCRKAMHNILETITKIKMVLRNKKYDISPAY
jgi:hypothetical protein